MHHMPDNPFIIRPYQKSDRAFVRHISYETADTGEPFQFLADREFMADILTGYYTDYEPESSFVLESAGKVYGYVNGALNSRRCSYIMRTRIYPLAFLRAVMRGTIFRLDFLRLIFSGVRSYTALSKSTIDLDEYPAHVHINIHDGFRRSGVGSKLIQTFEKYASMAGVRGIHARVRDYNQRARNFFERNGYILSGVSSGITLIRNDSSELKYRTVTYVKKI